MNYVKLMPMMPTICRECNSAERGTGNGTVAWHDDVSAGYKAIGWNRTSLFINARVFRLSVSQVAVKAVDVKEPAYVRVFQPGPVEARR